MAYTKTTEKAVYNFVENNKELIESVELMSVSEPYGFNDMEGYHSDIRLKVVTVKGYKNKFLEFTINSTYLDYGMETFENYAEACLDTISDCLFIS